MTPAVRPNPLRALAAGLLAVTLLGVVVAASTGTARGSDPLALASPTVPVAPPAPRTGAAPTTPTTAAAPPPVDDGALGVAGGAVADGHLSPFDEGVPAVANLDPALRRAVQAAARAAASRGIRLHLTSGWRSRAYQRSLLAAAIRKYGSEREARRYVATPDASHHVTGDAVDIGPTAADDWLQRHGATYGLCRTYANEVWHFELATEPGGTCPRMLPDASAG